MKKLLLLLLLTLTCCTNLFSQCDTKITKDHISFVQDQKLKQQDIQKTNKLDSVAFTFHMYHNGTPEIPEKDIYQEFEHVKEAFNPIFKAYIFKIIYYNDPLIYQNYNHKKFGDLIQARKYKNTINIVVAQYDGGCGFAWYPSDDEKYCFIDEQCFYNRSTISHEIGHYLYLYHTFNTYNGIELVDGSNCKTAGDLVCDTPADPQKRECVTNCIFDCDYTDANGDTYDPLVGNLMSYYSRSCRVNRFTDGQYKRMTNALYGIYSHLVNGVPLPPIGEYIDLVIDTTQTTFEVKNRRVTIKTGVKNIGGLAKTKKCYLGYYASKNDSYDEDDKLLHSDELERKISQGETDTENHAFTMPDGFNYIILIADHTEKIDEDNDKNNTFVSPNLFEKEPPIPPTPTCIPYEELINFVQQYKQ